MYIFNYLFFKVVFVEGWESNNVLAQEHRLDSSHLTALASSMEAETFTLKRDFAPAKYGSQLWGGFMVGYTGGDVGLHLAEIFEDSPATRAGMSPMKRTGCLMVAINGVACYDPEETDFDAQAQRTNAFFDAETKGPRNEEPFTLSIRQPTRDEIRNAILPRMTMVLDTALGQELSLKDGKTMPGVDLLKSQQGVDMLKRVVGIEDNDVDKLMIFVEEITRRGWKGTAQISVSLRCTGTELDAAEIVQRIQAEFPDTKVEEFRRDLPTYESALSASKRQNLEDLLAKAYPDLPAADGQEACVVCLGNARKVALLHGSSAHACVCNACAMRC
jgi:hypothetical protein